LAFREKFGSNDIDSIDLLNFWLYSIKNTLGLRYSIWPASKWPWALTTDALVVAVEKTTNINRAIWFFPFVAENAALAAEQAWGGY
jgi:hypothetical protein